MDMRSALSRSDGLCQIRYNAGMLMQSYQFKDIAVINMRSGQPEAKLTQPIIDPFKLEIVGFYTTHTPENILLIRNIRELNRKQVMVDDTDTFSTQDELPRLKEVLDINYQLKGKRVVTHSRKRLGKVEDYIVDTISYHIEKIHVHQPLWRNFSGSTLIIDRKQILEVDNVTVTVSDATIESGALATQQTPT